MTPWQTAIASTLLLSIPTLSPTAQAQPPAAQFIATYNTYQAGAYTITLGDNHPQTGYVYRGCDTQARCIDLQHGTSWYDGYSRGITWENGDYYYAVSWRDGDRRSSMVLTVYQSDRVLVRESMVEIVQS